MDMHQLRLASSLVATWQYARIYQAPVPKKYANLCSSHDCSFVHCALGRIIDWRFRWRAGRGRRVGHQGAVEFRLPAIFQWPETTEDGGLLGYGPSFLDIFRQRATIVAKILRGTKPGDLPVEQPSTFKLAVNLKTAKTMNYNVPAGLLLRADKIIE